MTYLALFEKFQTTIIGALGFFGVILTLAVNARLARNTRHCQIEHERKTLATGLAVEFEVCLEGFQRTWKNISNPIPAKLYNIPIYNMSPIYEANLGKVGLLKPATLRAVHESYLSIEQFRNVVLMAGSLVNDGRSVAVKGTELPKLAPDFPRFMGVIESAIQALHSEVGGGT